MRTGHLPNVKRCDQSDRVARLQRFFARLLQATCGLVISEAAACGRVAAAAIQMLMYFAYLA